jgi:hypothetical protein
MDISFFIRPEIATPAFASGSGGLKMTALWSFLA